MIEHDCVVVWIDDHYVAVVACDDVPIASQLRSAPQHACRESIVRWIDRVWCAKEQAGELRDKAAKKIEDMRGERRDNK